MATIWTSSASAAVVIFSKQEVKTELNNAVTVALITSVKAKVTTAFNHPSNQLLMGGNMSEQINSGPNPKITASAVSLIRSTPQAENVKSTLMMPMTISQPISAMMVAAEVSQLSFEDASLIACQPSVKVSHRLSIADQGLVKFPDSKPACPAKPLEATLNKTFSNWPTAGIT